MARLLRRLWRDRSGISATEFALILPVLFLLSIGTFEVSRFIMVNQKLQNGGFILADLVARDRTISEDQLVNIFLAIGNLIQPFPFDTRGTVILTSVGAVVDDTPFVNWQRTGAGGLAAASEVGLPGQAATLPDDLPIRANETIIVAEVYFDYEPVFWMPLDNRVIRKVAYYKPRLGTLETVLP
jgi:Flp pilus assembly pilin Flp